jgi:catechol 2,3-dioxygenase-like lactoylglutathione lyase family enzyme
MSVRPRRIGHIGMVARDLPRMVAFYEEVLGMQVSDRMPYPADSPYHEAVWLRINSDHHVISMFGLREHDAPLNGSGRHARPGMHHLAFEMASFEDLKRAVRFVRDAGIEVQGQRTGGPGCQLRLYFWDPEDNMIELYWALDQIGWDGATRPYPAVETIDLETFDVAAWLEWKGPEFEPAAAQAGIAGIQPA